MTEAEQQQGRIRRLLSRVAPGVEAFSRYQLLWLPSDIAADLSVALPKPAEGICKAHPKRRTAICGSAA
jgi:hypothetical protein